MHWKPSAALWREDWTLKPAGEVFVDLVARKWRASEELTTDAKGQCQLRGFLGDYEITVKIGRISKTVKTVVNHKGTNVHVQFR